MSGRRLGWAVAATVAIIVTACCLGVFAWFAAATVIEQERHPYADSLAPLGLFAGLLLFGWTPVVAAGLWQAWTRRFVAGVAAGEISLAGAAAAAGVRLPRWWWRLRTVAAILAPLTLAITLWQGFAEHRRMPAVPVVVFQWGVLACWVVTTVGTLIMCERAIRGSGRQKPDLPVPMRRTGFEDR